MQNKYTGDVGDFGKYGLLRGLCRDDAHDAHGPRLSLGVVWYLVPDEKGTSDGKHVKYLEDTPQNHRRFQSCDEKLWDALRKIVTSNRRNVRSIQESGLFPDTTVYHDAVLSWAEGTNALSERGRAARRAFRNQWLSAAARLTKGKDIVFFDPDNGLDTKTGPYCAKGIKYAFFNEIAPYCERRYKRHQSVVVYQHLSRRGTALQQARGRMVQMVAKIGADRPFALWSRRGTARLFLIAPAGEHAELVRRRARSLCDGPWGKHFVWIDQADSEVSGSKGG